MLSTLKTFVKKSPAISVALREAERRAMFIIHGRDFGFSKQARLFAPNSEGARTVIADLTMQSVTQTFPFLSEFTHRYSDRRAEELTAKEFCQLHGSPAAADELKELFIRTGSDKSTRHDYHYVYGPMLAVPERVQNIFEIGLGTNNTDVTSHMGAEGKPGASLRAFRDFLPNCQVFGADVDKRILFQEDRIRTFFVDQTDIDSFSDLAKLNVLFDLIIDDGLHSPNANIAVMLFGLEKLAINGWLVVEDIDESARPFWQVVSSLIPSRYRSYLITARGALVFAIQNKADS